MDKILSNHDKSDYSLNARSFDGIDVFSPMVNKEGNDHFKNSPSKNESSKYKLPDIQNRKDVFNDSLNNRQVEVYSHETNFSRKPYSEFVKNYNKLSSVLVTRDLKSESYSIMSNNNDEKQSNVSNASSFVEIFKRHKENTEIEESEKGDPKNILIGIKNPSKKIRGQTAIL